MIKRELLSRRPAPAPVHFSSVFFAKPAANNATLAAAALQFERTQPWTMFCQIQVVETPQGGVTDAAILFTNVLGASPFTGYEVWIDQFGLLRCRIINTAFTNICSVVGSINVCTGLPVMVAVSYDGSSTPAGIKMYVNGVKDTGMTTEYNTLSASIISAGQIWEIGNQLNFTFGLIGYMGFISMDATARGSLYIGLYGLGKLPPNDASHTQLYLTFADQTGTTITDHSASGFNATLAFASEWAGVLPSPSTIAFDAIASNTGTAVSSLAATLTTAGAGELIYVTSVTTNATPPTIADTAGLVWTIRGNIALTGGSFLYSWYAISASKLTADVVTLTGTAIYQINATAFMGQSAKPLAIPVGTYNGNLQMSVPTTAPSGIVLAFYAMSTTTGTPGSGWTAIYNTDFTLLEYKYNSTMIANEVALASSTGTLNGGIIEVLN